MIVPLPLLNSLIALAASSPDQEVCGLLFGEEDRLDSATTVNNVADNPACAFEIDPAVLIAAHRAMREGGPSLMGTFHSHPNGSAAPSKVDAENAAPDGQIWLIIAAQKVTAWRAVPNGQLHGRFDQLPILPC